jgi:DNA-directed RNA polymerase omega subunit
MDDSSKTVAMITRDAVTTRRGRSGGAEFDILIEDVLSLVPNKYLAVNIAARRARELNNLDLPVSEFAKTAKKPTTQALLELIDGRLQYETLTARPTYTEPETEVDADGEDEVTAIFDEFGEDDDFDLDIVEDFDDSDDS